MAFYPSPALTVGTEPESPNSPTIDLPPPYIASDISGVGTVSPPNSPTSVFSNCPTLVTHVHWAGSLHDHSRWSNDMESRRRTFESTTWPSASDDSGPRSSEEMTSDFSNTYNLQAFRPSTQEESQPQHCHRHQARVRAQPQPSPSLPQSRPLPQPQSQAQPQSQPGQQPPSARPTKRQPSIQPQGQPPPPLPSQPQPPAQPSSPESRPLPQTPVTSTSREERSKFIMEALAAGEEIFELNKRMLYNSNGRRHDNATQTRLQNNHVGELIFKTIQYIRRARKGMTISDMTAKNQLDKVNVLCLKLQHNRISLTTQQSMVIFWTTIIKRVGKMQDRLSHHHFALSIEILTDGVGDADHRIASSSSRQPSG